MSKKYSFSPFVFLLDVGGDDDVSGGGSGQSGVHPLGPVACNFDFWLKNFATDYDGDGYDMEDFGQWWTENGFTMDAWNEYNPGVPFPGGGGSEPSPVPGGDEGGEAGGDAVSEAISEMMGDIPG